MKVYGSLSLFLQLFVVFCQQLYFIVVNQSFVFTIPELFKQKLKICIVSLKINSLRLRGNTEAFNYDHRRQKHQRHRRNFKIAENLNARQVNISFWHFHHIFRSQEYSLLTLALCKQSWQQSFPFRIRREFQSIS